MRDKTGFTLLEILVALFIFTIIAMIIVSALHTVFTSQSATEKKAEQLAALQMTLMLMSRDIEQAINRSIMNGYHTEEAALLGTSNTLTLTHAGFVNPLGQAERSSLQRTRYTLENETVMRITWPVLDQTAKTPSLKRPLCSSVTALTFEYLDEHNHFTTRWPPSNKKELSLPRGVRVTLTVKNRGNLSQFYFISGSARANDS